MSGLSFGQKKKKQALRRLSGQGATPRSKSRQSESRSQQAWPPRRRSREEAGEFPPGRLGMRENKRTRSSALSSGDSDSSGTNLFAGRRIVKQDDSQNFLISKARRDVSDSDSDLSRSSLSSAGNTATGGIFGRMQPGQFGKDEAGSHSDDSIIKPATSSAENIFGKRSFTGDSKPLESNPFASRVAQSRAVAKPTTSQVPPSSSFKFTVPGASEPSNSAPTDKIQSVFGKSSFGKQEPSSTDAGQSAGFSNFAFTVKQTTAGSGSTSTTASQSVAGIQGSASGPQPSSLSSFTFRQPGIVTSPETARITPFGVPEGSSQGPSGTDSAGVFGMKSDAPKPESPQKFTFAKPRNDSFGSFKSTSPIKRPSSDQHHDDSYTKRPITKWTDPFSETEEKDLSDLETFGAAPAPKEPKKSLIKKGSLFNRAISDASMGRNPGSHDRRPERTRRDDGKRRDGDRDERGRRDGRDREERRGRGDDENKSSSSRMSISRSVPGATHRYTSAEEIKHLRSIVIQNVPDVANSRSHLRRLFSEYGTVIKVQSMPSKATAVIHFEDHESARAAKKKVRVLKDGTKPVSIFWSQTESGSSRPGSRSSDKIEKPTSKDSTSSRPLAPLNRAKNVSSSNERPVTRHRDTAVTSTLKRQVAMAAEEKKDILETRDKAIRQGYKKQYNLATAQTLKGTCPDMCPEKERYTREYQRRISLYEGPAQDKVHHPRAVKEYSRSSADQEEPLHHELRPVGVLMMTMNYLMNNIMNRGEQEARWADWFDFLWNRTRAIRKDITQQHLCDTTAVELMEKCSRFHIFCAHRLCEQDRAAFDPKINNENLTKCQQSLKQFYHDLAMDDIFCPSEAEFRTYDVLLNLNEGDILRQVQQYRPEVRSSEDVIFAVKAFSAVNSNNYVKFFKLIRSASYMNACSMHRYFTQMRSQAILIMNKAYSGPKTTQYPLEDIIRLLAFEGQEEATEFCEAHGLLVSDGSVHFHRSSFTQPESAIIAFRSSIIEEKNDNNIGQVVNGAPLPPNHIHEPSSSFTDAGVYKGDITSTSTTPQDVPVTSYSQREAEEEETAVETIPTTSASREELVQSETDKLPDSPRRTHQYSNAAIKDVAKEMFLDVINGMARELSQGFLQQVHFVKTGSFELVNRVLGDSLKELTREVAMETYQEECRQVEEKRLVDQRQMEHERLQAQHAAARQRQMQQKERLRQESIDRVSAEAVESLINDIVKQESQNMAVGQYREIRHQLKQDCIARSSEVISSDILQETLQDECHQVAGEVIQTAIEQRDQKLAELEKCVLMSRTARYLQKWQRVYTLRVRLKRSQLTFPAAPPNHSLLDQLKALWPSRTRQVPGRPDSAGAFTLDTPFSVLSGQERVAKTILRRHYLTCLRRQKAWAPFDLPTVLCNIFHQSQHASQANFNHQYWKLVMSLPDVGSMSHDWSESFDWLQAKLKRGKLQDRFREETLHDSEKVQTLSLYTAEVPTQHGRQNLPMSLCTKVTKGHVNDELGCNQLLGTNAVLFVLADINETDWQESYERLCSVLEAKPANPPIPVLVTILGDPSDTNNVEAGLRLQELHHASLLSTYHIMVLAMDVDDPRCSESLSEGIQWLASHNPHPPHLEEDTLKGYVDTGLMKLFSLPLHEDAKLRHKAGLPGQDAQYVVSLYNAVVQHLGAVACSRSLKNLSWPLMEFAVTQRDGELPKPNWNLPKALTLLGDRINRLQIPQVPHLHEDCGWKVVCESLHNYVLDYLPGREADKAPLTSRVQWLLDRSRRSFQNTCYLTYDTPGCEPTARHIPWLSIIEACITHMVSMINAEDDDYSDEDPVIVYYFEHKFDSFTSPEEWKQARYTTREDTYTQPDSLSKSILETVHQRQTQLSETHSSDNQSQAGAVSKVELEHESPSVVAAKDTAEYLKIMLHAEKQETQRYEELLNSWLNNSGSPQTNQDTDSPDRGTPLTVHIPQWPDEKTRRPLSEDIIMRDDGAIRLASRREETLSERLEKLKQQIALERRADELEELRLAHLLGL